MKKVIQKRLLQLQKDNDGFGVIEMVLIIVVLIALVVIFRDQIGGLVANVLSRITESGDDIMNTTITPAV